jgi:hypothetical protein
MDDMATVITETAWQLYRALRTYPRVKKAIEDARAVVPEEGRVYRYPVPRQGGTEGGEPVFYETTIKPATHALAAISHARAIVLAFNLDDITKDETFNMKGVNILAECIAHEIEQDTEATKSQCERWYALDFIRYNDE